MQSIKNEQTKLRDSAFYEAYKKALSSGGEVSHSDAIRMALESPQPRMWVSFYGVYRALLCVVKGSRRPPKDTSRSKLLCEVERKYKILREKRMFSDMSLFFMASFIIAEPSQGFYISEVYAKKLVWRIRKERRAAWIRKK